MWIWFFFFSFLISLVSFLMGLSFLKSIYMVSWEVTIFRESNFEMLFLVDSFSMVFVFTVGLVSSFVLFYSNGYMEGSLFKKKFIYTLVFFIISMFVLSMSGDLFWVMIGWDGLGFSSMCLIFFFQNWKSFNSSVVTFISNRIGDFFIISLFCFVILFYGSLFFVNSVSNFFLGFFLCLGAFSKSAQVPFSAWLPMAMAAPTPVSSLVHSSTLVTAGVFLLIRFKSFLCKDLFKVVFFFSLITIVLAGMSSVGEYDLKKVIALSTLSHIGLMMMFVGMESFVSAKVHLVVHAFFKSLLFMISGYVIHDNNNFQDVRLISVSSKNDFFSLTFLLSVFSMMGVPFFSGFYSKEILLGLLFSSFGGLLSVVLFFFSVSMTCSYSVRLVFYFFFPHFSLLPLVSKDEYPVKVFFFYSIISSFFGGMMVFMLISKEGMVACGSFSFFQKFGLVISIIFGLVIGGLFSFFISSVHSGVLMVCQNMWMIESTNFIFQKLFFDVSFFFCMKGDVKGLLDWFIVFLKDEFSYLGKLLMKVLYLDPFFYIKIICFVGLSGFFFSFLIGSKCTSFSIWMCKFYLHEEMRMKFNSGFHPFHVVDLSPWPLVMSLSVFSLVLNLYHYLNLSGSWVWMLESLMSSVLVSIVWWRDVIRESTFQGRHTKEVQKGLILGVILFISSEVMFFFSFFFGFLFSALCPDIEVGEMWPPMGIEPLSFMMVPLLNTLVLLSSGVSITWSHHALLEENYNNYMYSITVTIFLGFLFSFLQYEEYLFCSFTMADSVYGSFFFLMTGFHGIHVIVGVVFISVSLFRMMINHFSKTHHFGFEAAAWYWHFVDVVWLFLYVTVYWWGS